MQLQKEKNVKNSIERRSRYMTSTGGFSTRMLDHTFKTNFITLSRVK